MAWHQIEDMSLPNQIVQFNETDMHKKAYHHVYLCIYDEI